MVLKAFFGTLWRVKVARLGSRKLNMLGALWFRQCTHFWQGQPASGSTCVCCHCVCFEMVVPSGDNKAQASHLHVWPSL